MLIVRGVNVFPSQIEAALCRVKDLTPNFIIDVWKKDGMDEVEIACERAPESSPAETEHIKNEAKKRIKDSLGVNIEVSIAEPDALPRSEGKAVRIKRHKEPHTNRV